MKWLSGILVASVALICSGAGIAQTSPPAVETGELPPPLEIPPLDPTPVSDGPEAPGPPAFLRPAPFPTALGGGLGGGGGGGYGGLMGGGVSSLGSVGLFAPRVNYGAVWYPDQPVRGQNTDLGSVRQDFSMSMPAWHSGPDTVMFSANARSVLYDTQAVLPDSGRPFPNTLWNLGVGMNYMHMFDNGWMAGGGVTVGSASDKPFNSIREVNVGVSGFLRIPSGEHNAWMVGAMYSPTGELWFPIPIVAYMWNPNDHFSMNIGLPFSMRWRPLDDLLLDFLYVPLRNIHFRATYRIADGVGVYAGFDWNNEAYFLADRASVSERFFYYQKTLSSGVRFNIGERGALDFSGGWAFDRFFFQGVKYADDGYDRVDVGNSLFISARFMWRF